MALISIDFPTARSINQLRCCMVQDLRGAICKKQRVYGVRGAENRMQEVHNAKGVSNRG